MFQIILVLILLFYILTKDYKTGEKMLCDLGFIETIATNEALGVKRFTRRNGKFVQLLIIYHDHIIFKEEHDRDDIVGYEPSGEEWKAITKIQHKLRRGIK